ncbi:MAG TPA: ATP-binding protein, partial [Solirubrobacteraceae bacterium]|nr:ATP-binding protein [Solirubrobacteraceae bacterium]
SAELARLLLGAMQLQDALPVAAQRVAEALGAEHAAILLAPHAAAGAGAGEAAIPLEADGEPLGTLLVPAGTSPHQLAWTRARLVPSLVSILAAALHRERLGAEVVETAALRRSDELKTAVLRSVSHDLRTPVTAILSAAGTLDPARAEEARVGEVRDLVTDAATRLSLLIEKLLDLSVLQAGTHEPRVGSYSLEEVVHEAIAHVGGADGFRLSIDPELPSIRGDAVQLERAFANVLENAARHSGGEPVAVRARALAATGGATQQGGRVRVLVVDRGPGIARSEWERVFLPFYRAPGADQEHHGSGLGLAIAKGFIEANGGRIAVESVPGQGTSMVIELPLGDPDSEPVGAPLAAGAAGGR